jgi:hypothetical protein
MPRRIVPFRLPAEIVTYLPSPTGGRFGVPWIGSSQEHFHNGEHCSQHYYCRKFARHDRIEAGEDATTIARERLKGRAGWSSAIDNYDES